MKKKALLLGAGAVALAYGDVLEYFFDFAFKRDDQFYDDPLDFSYQGEELAEKKKERAELEKWLAESKTTNGYIKSFDGLDLFGVIIENNATKNYLIIVHGMRSDHMMMLKSAYEFSNLGYNILLIDQRASGKSQGEHMTYGFKESIDIAQWIEMLDNRIADCRIALYGVSMGAASVMLSLRNKLPKAVKCVVEDCGYTSAYDAFSHILKKDFKLPSWPLLPSVLALAKRRIGVSIAEAAPIDALKDNEIPILFVHGTADDFVPFEMAKKLYHANKGIKKFYPVEGKGHSVASEDPDYYQNINSFISDYL